jgi:hypothetical protein
MDREPEQHDALDRLLIAAGWNEPTPEAVVRLRGQWRSLMVRRLRRRRQRWFAAATAATILVAVGVTCISYYARIENDGVPLPGTSSADGNPPASTACKQAMAHHVNRPHPSPLPKGEGTGRKARPRTSRPPNAYELVVRAAYRRTRVAQRCGEASESGGDTEPSKPLVACVEQPAKSENDQTVQQELAALLARGDAASIDQFLDRAADPRTADAALDSLSHVSDPPIQALLQSLHAPRPDRRLAAARVLGRLNQPAVSCELIAMARRGVHRQEAFIALLSSSEPSAQQFVTAAARDVNLAAALWNAQRQANTSFPRRS